MRHAGQDRRGDGGAHRRERRRAHGLRHVQGGRSRHRDHGRAACSARKAARAGAGCAALARCARDDVRVTLKPGRDFSVRAGHPWIFSGAIATVDGESAAGAPAEVRAADGRVLGYGTWNSATSIAVRMMTRGARPIDAALVHERLERALALRALVTGTDALRLVNGEGDGFPGLVLDRYGEFVVCQFLTAGADALKALVLDALGALLPVRGVYERSEGNVRTAEGLARRCGVLAGEEPPARARDRRERPALRGRRARRTEDRGSSSISVPIATCTATVARGRSRAEPLRVQRRLLDRGGARRRRTRDLGRQLGAGARARGGGLASNDSPVDVGDLRARRRVRVSAAATCRRPTSSCSTRRRSPAAVRTASAPSRLQGRQPPRALRLAAPGALLLTFSCSQHVAADGGRMPSRPPRRPMPVARASCLPGSGLASTIRKRSRTRRVAT